MKKIFLFFVIIIFLSFFCTSCISNKNNTHISEPTSDNKNRIEKNGDTNKNDKEYFFEPSVSVIEGILTTRMYFGPPGYGEDPDNDTKEYPFILKLDKPINVISSEDDTENSNNFGVQEVQVVTMNDSDFNKLKKSINGHISIKGTFFTAYTGHHHTDILIQVEKIFD